MLVTSILELNSAFDIIHRCAESKGREEKKKHRIFWCDTQTKKLGGTKVEFDGIPYMVLGKRTLECQHGPDRNIAKRKRAISSEVGKRKCAASCFILYTCCSFMV